jgi:predicted glycosyltransferase
VKVFFHVQHLLGIGHLKRAAVLARALAAAGFDVTLASGGLPVAGLVPREVRLVQLPPAAAEDASFKHLVDDSGRRVDEAWKERRRDFLLQSYSSFSPQVLLVELFPFGRRQLRFELLPLLERAAGNSLVVCSVRDLIQDKPARHAEMLAAAARFFDQVLVHGDARLAAFPLAAQLGGKLHYTGYVVDEPPAAGEAGKGEVLVSAGGGAVGHKLLETALRARPLSVLRDRPWRVLTGVNGPKLTGFGEKNLLIQTARPDFTTLLRNCEVSVSQGGYNTVMETLQARARAVLVPFAALGESEQAERARLLAKRGLVQVLEEAALSPQRLAAAMERAIAQPRPAAGAVDLGGARRSAELLKGWLRA